MESATDPACDGYCSIVRRVRIALRDHGCRMVVHNGAVMLERPASGHSCRPRSPEAWRLLCAAQRVTGDLCSWEQAMSALAVLSSEAAAKENARVSGK